MASRHVRHVLAAAAFLLPACVVRLDDKNAALPNGGVTGAPADCSVITPPPKSAPGGAAAARLVGRYDLSDPARPRFDWSGNWVEARFDGTRVSVGMEVPDDNKDVIFTAAIDDRPPFQFTVSGSRPNGVRQTKFELANNLPPGEHKIRVHRDTEASAGGIAVFLGFDVAPGKLLPPLQRQRRIEVIGDSITCGYGDKGQNATCPYDIKQRDVVGPDGNVVTDEKGNPLEVRVPVTENQYIAYTSIVGRELDADVTTLCWSGKGVSINYRETGDDGKPLVDAKSTMVDLYERTVAYADPALTPPIPNNDKWDFTKDAPEPQVVLMNLGTNDFTRDEEQPRGVSDGIDLAKFQSVYEAFVDHVRSLRPNAHIFLMVPPMVSDTFPLDNARKDFRASLDAIVAERQAKGDNKVYAMELVEQGTRYGLGCDYHPNETVHQIMAEQVLGAVKSKTCW